MAKILLNGLTNYEAWQMKKYGNIIAGIQNTSEDELTNSGLEELDRLAEWITGQSQPDQLFIIDPPATRVGRLRRKKRFDKMIIYGAILRVSKTNK